MGLLRNDKWFLRERIARHFPTVPAIPGVMPSPPTITQGTPGASPSTAISGSYLVSNTDSAFAYLGTRTGATANGFTIVDAVRATSGATSGGTGWAVAFMHDGTEFELYFQSAAAAGKYNVLVDGQYVVSRSSPKALGGSGLNSIDKITFGARGVRRITVEMDANCRFGGVRSDATGRIFKAPVSPLRMVVIGDSFGEGSTQTRPSGGYAFVAGRHLLGIDDIWSASAGATGIIATAGGTKLKYRDRSADVIAAAPDIVLVQGSVNDYGSEAAAVTEVALLFAALRAGLPAAVILASGVLNTHGTNSGYDTLGAGIEAALASVSGPVGYIANTQSGASTGAGTGSGQWAWGTGNTGATTGTGNADLYCDTDGTHPNAAGHDYLAWRMGMAARAAILAL